MQVRLLAFLFLGWTLASHSAVPDFGVLRTGVLFFAVSDLTTNGIPALTNAERGVVVSEVPAFSACGGRLTVVNTQVWTRFYGGPGGTQDNLSDMAVSSDGQVTLSGSSSGSTYDVITLRYGPDGTALWTNRYDSPSHSHDYASCVRTDAAGNAYMAGLSELGGESRTGFVVKYGNDGLPAWTNTLPQPEVVGAKVSSGGDLVLALSAVATHTNFYLIAKIDPLGRLLWTNEYHTSPSPYDHLNAMALDDSGAVIATGTDYGTLKYSAAGRPLWTNRLALPQTGVPSDVVVDKAGSVIVTGDTWDFGAPDPPLRTYTTVKYAADGAPLWTNRLAPSPYQGGGLPQVLVAPTGDVVVVAGTSNSSFCRDEFAITKLSSAGASIWTLSFQETNASGLNFKIATAMDAAGDLFLMTSSSGARETDSDFVTVKFNARGVPVWTNRFNGGEGLDDIAQAIGIDASGNVYVSGITGGLSGGGDFSLVRYVEFLHYTPPPNFVGTDSFTFVATDPAGNSATNTVIVRVEAESLWFNLAHSDLRGTATAHRLRLDGAHGGDPVILYGGDNFSLWTPVATNLPVNGAVEFLVPPVLGRQFYRAVQDSEP